MNGEALRHDWRLLGGSGGWEVWGCANCRRSTIPSPFGFLWPNLLGVFFRKYRCQREGGSADEQ